MNLVLAVRQRSYTIQQAVIRLLETYRNRRWFIPVLSLASLVIISGVVSGAYMLTRSITDDQPAVGVENTGSSTEDSNNQATDQSKDTQTSDSNQDSNSPVPSGIAGGGDVQSGQVAASHVSSGGKNLKTSGSTSIDTATISPQGGGMLLVWVGTAIGGEETVVEPSISGLNLNWSVVKFSQKKEGAPRAMTLFKAILPSNPGSGPLTIHFNTTLTSSHWFWEIDRVSGTTIKNVYERVDGGFLTSYSMTLSPATQAGNAAIAGMLVGNNDVGLTPGSGLTLLGTGGTSFATVGSAWTTQSRGVMDFSWSKAAHCLMVAVEVAP